MNPFFSQDRNCIRLIDTRVMVDEIGTTKQWTLPADAKSLTTCLLGRLASAINTEHFFEKMSEVDADGQMVDASSQLFIFSILSYSFDQSGDGGLSAKTQLLQGWKELLIEHGHDPGDILEITSRNCPTIHSKSGHYPIRKPLPNLSTLRIPCCRNEINKSLVANATFILPYTFSS